MVFDVCFFSEPERLRIHDYSGGRIACGIISLDMESTTGTTMESTWQCLRCVLCCFSLSELWSLGLGTFLLLESPWQGQRTPPCQFKPPSCSRPLRLSRKSLFQLFGSQTYNMFVPYELIVSWYWLTFFWYSYHRVLVCLEKFLRAVGFGDGVTRCQAFGERTASTEISSAATTMFSFLAALVIFAAWWGRKSCFKCSDKRYSCPVGTTHRIQTYPVESTKWVSYFELENASARPARTLVTDLAWNPCKALYFT